MTSSSTEKSSLLGIGREDPSNAGRLKSAREAFEGSDPDASRRYHESKESSEESPNAEGHRTEGEFLKAVVFGGLDGILTSFAIVAGAAGGHLSPQVVLILGFSNILADALSMGVGEFLSSKANSEWILSERKREQWELENYPEGEIREMVEIYESKGMTREDAVLVINTMAKYKEFFIDIMMAQELDLQVPKEDHIIESVKEGIIMFCAFAFFGALPLLGYVIFPIFFPNMTQESLFISACCVTGIVLFFMGALKSMITTQGAFHAGMETLFLGGLCATVAYVIGLIVQDMVG